MSKKWLKNKTLLFLFFWGNLTFSQTQIDTLKKFTKTEVLTELISFSSQELLDEKSALLGLDEILENSSPVYLKNYGNGQLATLSIRGNGASQTQLFWNGFKMNSPTLGQADLSLIPAFFVSTANLNYSGASSANGSGGIGGSLELTNKLNWKKGIHGIAGLEFASFNNSSSLFGISYGGKRFFNELKILHKKGNNNFEFIDISKQNQPLSTQINNELSQYGAQYSLGYQVNNKNIIQSTLLYFNSFREIPPIIGGVSNFESQKDNYLRSFVSWKSFQENFNSDLRISYFNESLGYSDPLSSIYSLTKVNTYQGQYRINFDLFKKIKIESSIQSSYSQVQSNGFEGNRTRVESGIYARASQEFKKLYYEVFARQEYVDDKFSPLTGGGGLVYEPGLNNLKFKTNVSSNYRVPTLNDLYWNPGGNMNLNPERGWTSEVGAEYSFVPIYGAHTKRGIGWEDVHKGVLKFGANFFYNQTNNWIQWLPTDFGYWQPFNVKDIINKGIESNVSFDYFLQKHLNFKAVLNYTYTDSKVANFIDDSSQLINYQTVYVPEHKANFMMSFRYFGFQIHYTQIYNGRVFLDASNSSYLPHYFPANAGINYKLQFSKQKSLSFGVKVRNLFNEPYHVVANRPLPGRNYSFSAQFHF